MIVVFNGPPGSGKDEACNFLSSLYGFQHASFKHELFKETIKYFDVSAEWFHSGYNDRKTKETPEPQLNGLSRREALIFVSEDVIKPKYGLDYFGVKAADSINTVSDYCFSDGGFIDEFIPLINKAGEDNICIVQLYRHGCSYKNDSRNYIYGILQEEIILGTKNPDVNNNPTTRLPIRMYQLHTNSTLGDFHQAIRTIIRKETSVYKKSSILRKPT
jgi:hypothetical protein